MKEPTPEAVAAVARVLATSAPKRYLSTQPTNEEHHARAILTFLAEHPEHLGLEWEERSEWVYMDGVEPAGRRIVGPWKEHA